MREVITVRFLREGNYTIWQRGTAFDDMMEQVLMTSRRRSQEHRTVQSRFRTTASLGG